MSLAFYCIAGIASGIWLGYSLGKQASKAAGHQCSGSTCRTCNVVDRFAEQMKWVLVCNSPKGHWGDCSLKYLHYRLEQELRELTELVDEVIETEELVGKRTDGLLKSNTSLPLGVKAKILHESVDVANFAMMIADNFGGL